MISTTDVRTDPTTDRAGGVMLGLAVAEGWSAATEIALCVGDAAATGLPLTDEGALGLLGRNVRSLRLERHRPNGALDVDELLGVVAVIALAHLHDSPKERAEATRAVLAVLDAGAIVDTRILGWGEILAATVREGELPQDFDPNDRRDHGSHESHSEVMAESIRAAVHAVRVAERVGGSDDARFAAGLGMSIGAVAATGALLGARFGWRAVPRTLADQTHGWPDADSTALIGIGLLAARASETRSDRAAPAGGVVRIERWDETSDTASPATELTGAEEQGRTSGPRVWRRTQVVLTTSDADLEPQ
jgi:hypothetical protein